MSARKVIGEHGEVESALATDESVETVERVPLNRRGFLAGMGAVLVAPAAASGAARAVDQGYGAVYGAQYGDLPDDGAGEEPILGVETHVAMDVTESSATLTGELIDLQGYDQATVYFEWGERGDLSNSTPRQTLTGPGPFSAEMTDLESGVEHAFRAIAEGDDGSDVGDTLRFTTESGGDQPDAVPRIVQLDATDTSDSENPHAYVSVDWEVYLPAGELVTAELTVANSTREAISGRYGLDGRVDERSLELRIQQGAGETYTVELTVHSKHGTSTTAQTTFDSP